MNLVLNQNEVRISDVGELDFKDLAPESVKNCRFESYIQFGNPRITQFMLDLTAYTPFHRLDTIVDVKFHDLPPDNHTCIPGWHIDGSLLSSSNAIPEQYLLYVCGEDSMTEFCLDRVEVPKSLDAVAIIKAHKDEGVFRMRSGQAIRYDGLQMHRGTPAGKGGKRLLIRLMTSPVIRGQSYRQSVFEPYNR
jgi:hypothetical protein